VAYGTSFDVHLVICGTVAAVEGHRCADVVSNCAIAPASIALHWGAYVQRKSVAIVVDVVLNGNAEYQAIWAVINLEASALHDCPTMCKGVHCHLVLLHQIHQFVLCLPSTATGDSYPG
jgi:hypothetical protein